jgi:hypothetical protein
VKARWFTATIGGQPSFVIDLSRVVFARWTVSNTRDLREVLEVHLNGTAAVVTMPKTAGDAFLKALTEEAP